MEDGNILIKEHNELNSKSNKTENDINRIFEIRMYILKKWYLSTWEDNYKGCDLSPYVVENKTIKQKIMTQKTTQVIEILKKCKVEGYVIKLPQIRINRNEYVDVKKQLELIGGKWKGGKVFGFVFQTDPTDLLKQITNGKKRNIKKEFQFFATPEKLATEIVEIADLKQHDTILEPSAGQGAIIKAINKVCDVVPDCFELMDVNTVILNKSGLRFNLIGNDFLKHNGKVYTKIIANPPFTKNQDIDHLKEMYECLARGGRLVCITSESWVNGNQKKQIDFRNWLDKLEAEIYPILSGTFKESGTMISAKIVVINKPM
jgi:hypothetical protein